LLLVKNRTTLKQETSPEQEGKMAQVAPAMFQLISFLWRAARISSCKNIFYKDIFKQVASIRACFKG